MGLLLVLFLIVALLYSAVGFGGGSSYTALLAWRGESPEVIRLVSLSCNLVVAVIGGWASLKARQVKLKLLGPLLVSSIPGVWWGAELQIPVEAFFQILGIALAVAGGFLFLKIRVSAERILPLGILLLIGLLLGVLAGVTGIGGGIYLVPILHLLGAGKTREVAAVGTWFILVNSTMGLIVLAPHQGLGEFALLPVVVAAGGMMGSRLLQGVLNEMIVRRWTGALVLVVAAKMLLF